MFIIVSRGCDAVERLGVSLGRGTQRPRTRLGARRTQLRITHLEVKWLWDEITALAEKLGGDTSVMFFGASPPRG
jgi:hypothetical protein